MSKLKIYKKGVHPKNRESNYVLGNAITVPDVEGVVLFPIEYLESSTTKTNLFGGGDCCDNKN